MAASDFGGFSPSLGKFLRQLSRNNNREWFQDNKKRYEAEVLEPALDFIAAMARPLGSFAPRFVAIPKRVGGSLMRVYRDTRFSKDKTPYKTNVGIQFRHELGKDVHAPGYYVHIDPETVFLGVGCWHPAADALRAIRDRIRDQPDEWKKVRKNRRFCAHFELGGEALKRPPRGYDAEHPHIDDLKRKDFVGVRNLDGEATLQPSFAKDVESAFRAATPFMRFLCQALAVPY